jgi:hypothetical protein
MITTTHLDWLAGVDPGRVHRVDAGRVSLMDGMGEAGSPGWRAT